MNIAIENSPIEVVLDGAQLVEKIKQDLESLVSQEIITRLNRELPKIISGISR